VNTGSVSMALVCVMRHAFARQRHGQRVAVGRPRRRAVAPAEVGHLAPRAGGDFLHPHDGFLRLERHVGHLAPVGRPRGRDDGVRAGERLALGLGRAVGIGDDELKAAAAALDEGDARGEHALDAGEPLVHGVGDAVRGQAQVDRGHDVALAAQRHAANDVPELVTHVEAAVGQARDRACDQRVGGASAPFVHGRHTGLVERAGRVDAAELAAALEVGTDDVGDRLARGVLAAKANHRDGQLRGAHTADLDTELRQHGRREAGTEGAEEVASMPSHGSRIVGTTRIS
jgi:hypothetical protein